MTSATRTFLTTLLISVLLSALLGCAASYPKPSRPKDVKDITTTVPKLAGIPLNNAEKVLAFVALRVGKVAFQDTDVASLHGQVFEQDPAPGTIVRGGTRINVRAYRFVPPAGGSPVSQEK